MLDQVRVEEWQDLFTSIIEDADSNILLLDDEFKIFSKRTPKACLYRL